MSKSLYYSEGILTKQNIFESLNAVYPETNELKNPPKPPPKKIKPRKKKKSKAKQNGESSVENETLQDESTEDVTPGENISTEDSPKSCVLENKADLNAQTNETLTATVEDQLAKMNLSNVNDENAPPLAQSDSPDKGQTPNETPEEVANNKPTVQPSYSSGGYGGFSYRTIHIVNSNFKRGRGRGRGAGPSPISNSFSSRDEVKDDLPFKPRNNGQKEDTSYRGRGSVAYRQRGGDKREPHRNYTDSKTTQSLPTTKPTPTPPTTKTEANKIPQLHNKADKNSVKSSNIKNVNDPKTSNSPSADSIQKVKSPAKADQSIKENVDTSQSPPKELSNKQESSPKENSIKIRNERRNRKKLDEKAAKSENSDEKKDAKDNQKTETTQVKIDKTMPPPQQTNKKLKYEKYGGPFLVNYQRSSSSNRYDNGYRNNSGNNYGKGGDYHNGESGDDRRVTSGGRGGRGGRGGYYNRGYSSQREYQTRPPRRYYEGSYEYPDRDRRPGGDRSSRYSKNDYPDRRSGNGPPSRYSRNDQYDREQNNRPPPPPKSSNEKHGVQNGYLSSGGEEEKRHPPNRRYSDRPRRKSPFQNGSSSVRRTNSIKYEKNNATKQDSGTTNRTDSSSKSQSEQTIKPIVDQSVSTPLLNGTANEPVASVTVPNNMKKWSDESWQDDPVSPVVEKKISPYEEQTNRVKVYHEAVSPSVATSYSANQMIQEVNGNILSAPDDYSLVISVSEDFRMPSGLVAQFRQEFRRLDYLLDQNIKVGDVATLEDKSRFIYYLITKKVATLKVNIKTLKQCLLNLKYICIQNNIVRLAMPQIGLGTDRLDWKDVRQTLLSVFDKSNIHLLVYKQNDDYDADKKLKPTGAKLVFEEKPVAEIEDYTAIIVFSSLDGNMNDTFRSLDATFKIKDEFLQKLNSSSVGNIITIKRNDHYINIFIVNENKSQDIKFETLSKCLNIFKKHLYKDRLEYVAFEVMDTMSNNTDDILNEKIISYLKNILPSNIKLHICWPLHIEDKYSLSKKSVTVSGGNSTGHYSNTGASNLNGNHSSNHSKYSYSSKFNSNNNSNNIYIDSSKHFPKL